MGVPNYVYVVVVFWIVVYVTVYYVILNPSSSIAAEDGSSSVDSSILIKELTGRDLSNIAIEKNPFLSDSCANVADNYEKKLDFKKGIVVMVAHNVKKEHLVKSVSYYASSYFLVLLFSKVDSLAEHSGPILQEIIIIDDFSDQPVV